jgi:hypothetical protein
VLIVDRRARVTGDYGLAADAAQAQQAGARKDTRTALMRLPR